MPKFITEKDLNGAINPSSIGNDFMKMLPEINKFMEMLKGLAPNQQQQQQQQHPMPQEAVSNVQYITKNIVVDEAKAMIIIEDLLKKIPTQMKENKLSELEPLFPTYKEMLKPFITKFIRDCVRLE